MDHKLKNNSKTMSYVYLAVQRNPPKSDILLHVEQKVQHIAILNHIFLAFGAHFAGFFGARFALVSDEIIKAYCLRADEAFFKIGMDHAGGLRCGVTGMDGPGANFLDAGGEISLQAEQLVGGADQRFKPGSSRPRSARNICFSSSSSSAISASMAAQMATTSAFSLAACARTASR
jgi:hypothetical protein